MLITYGWPRVCPQVPLVSVMTLQGYANDTAVVPLVAFRQPRVAVVTVVTLTHEG